MIITDRSLRLWPSRFLAWAPPVVTENPMCHSGRDGDCYWSECPQERDGEPGRSGRHCPLDLVFDMWCKEYDHDRR
jgi:hypothetical protein